MVMYRGGCRSVGDQWAQTAVAMRIASLKWGYAGPSPRLAGPGGVDVR